MTTILGLMLPGGIIIASMVDALVFKDVKYIQRLDRYNYDDVRNATSEGLLITNILTSFFAIWFFIVVKDKPEHPPSLAAMEEAKERKFVAAFVAALKDTNFIMLIICFSLISGSLLAFLVVIGPVFSDYNLSPAEISWMIVGMVAIGIIGSFLAGYLLKFNWYRALMRLSCWGTCLSFFVAVFSLPTNSLGFVISNMMFAGLFLIPIIPISLNFS